MDDRRGGAAGGWAFVNRMGEAVSANPKTVYNED
jgi:hypothetical protein